MSACILIPIKMSNERLPGKNVKPLNGKPLYTYLFNTVSHINSVEQVFVDSSDDGILDLALEWGFSPLKRPVEYNADNVTGDDLLLRVVNELPYDIISLLHVTSPFLTTNTINQALNILNNEPNIDSVFGVTPINNRFWFDGNPVNHDINELARTQDLTPVFEEADIYFIRRNSLLKYGKRICGRFKMVEVNSIEATDVDDILDFIKAESLINAGLVESVTF